MKPEESKFKHIFVDVTYRCIMTCANCYSDKQNIPDPDLKWFIDILKRLPRRTIIRFIGGEPTLRADLPEFISSIRAIGHLPILLTNGIKLTNIEYVKTLKEAGLRTVHLSLNGGLKDELYESMDGMRCGEMKLRALDNLCKENFNVSAGMILVRGLNVSHLKEFALYLDALRQVREIKLRSVGRFGTYIDSDPLTMEELIEVCHNELGVSLADIRRGRRSETLYRFRSKGKWVQLTRWPDMGNPDRGYLLSDGRIVPFFEHMVASENEKAETLRTASARKAAL